MIQCSYLHGMNLAYETSKRVQFFEKIGLPRLSSWRCRQLGYQNTFRLHRQKQKWTRIREYIPEKLDCDPIMLLLTALSGDMSKLLLVARKIRRPVSTDFVISLVPDDFSRTSTTYVGKLRLLRTNYFNNDEHHP